MFVAHVVVAYVDSILPRFRRPMVSNHTFPFLSAFSVPGETFLSAPIDGSISAPGLWYLCDRLREPSELFSAGLCDGQRRQGPRGSRLAGSRRRLSRLEISLTMAPQLAMRLREAGSAASVVIAWEKSSLPVELPGKMLSAARDFASQTSCVGRGRRHPSARRDETTGREKREEGGDSRDGLKSANPPEEGVSR